jgi:hypothetical protein
VTSGAKPLVFDIWASLSDEEAAVLRTRLTDESRLAGEVFIHDGAIDECLYLIREGEVEVRRGDQVLAHLGIGDIVGEMAILNRQPRNADVVAVTNCNLSRLTAADFFDLCQQLPTLKIISHPPGGTPAELVERRCVDANHWIVRCGRAARCRQHGLGFPRRARRDGVRPEDVAASAGATTAVPRSVSRGSELAATIASREHRSTPRGRRALRHGVFGAWNTFGVAMPKSG